MDPNIFISYSHYNSGKLQINRLLNEEFYLSFIKNTWDKYFDSFKMALEDAENFKENYSTLYHPEVSLEAKVNRFEDTLITNAEFYLPRVRDSGKKLFRQIEFAKNISVAQHSKIFSADDWVEVGKIIEISELALDSEFSIEQISLSKTLIQELHFLIAYSYIAQLKFVRLLRKSLLRIGGMDIRAGIRSVISFLMMHMNNGDCDENVFTFFNRGKNYFLKTISNTCIIRKRLLTQLTGLAVL